MTVPDKFQLGPLLQRVQTGDRAALNELFSSLRPYLHAIVRKSLGETPDASDIVQSALGRINKNFEEFLKEDPSVPYLLAWIKKIVRNRAIDETRRRAGRPNAGASALNDLAEPTPLADRQDRDQRAVEVIKALSGLNARQRQVVELHYFDRLRDAEIASRLEMTIAAVRVLRCRALKELRLRIGENHASQ